MKKGAVNKERSRLESLLDMADVPKQQRAVLEAVMDNLAWQRVKLDEAREAMKEASITCEYDNGGGQRGTRVNPAFKAYTDLWRAYMIGVKALSNYLPTELQAEVVNDGLSVLERVKQMKAAANG